MTIEEFLKVTFKEEHGMCFRKRLVCNDGYNVSVQASSGHYCHPRRTQRNYESVELGFPSKEDFIINNYAESDHDYTDTVYGYVPVEVVQLLIDNHGGINIKLTIKN